MQGESKQFSQEDIALKRAVGHPKRLELLGCLARSKTGMEEAELSEALGLTPSLVTYHLGILRSADLVAHVEDAKPGTPLRYVALAG